MPNKMIFLCIKAKSYIILTNEDEVESFLANTAFVAYPDPPYLASFFL